MSGDSYPLSDLVGIRGVRETTAGREVNRAQQALDSARLAVVKAREDLESYTVWRIEEEKRSYEKIMNREVGLAKLEELKQEIRGLREKEADFGEAVLEAEKLVEERDDALIAAKSVHHQAMRDLRKLEEHREVWEAEQAVILARKEEDNMDDFRVAPIASIGE